VPGRRRRRNERPCIGVEDRNHIEFRVLRLRAREGGPFAIRRSSVVPPKNRDEITDAVFGGRRRDRLTGAIRGSIIHDDHGKTCRPVAGSMVLCRQIADQIRQDRRLVSAGDEDEDRRQRVAAWRFVRRQGYQGLPTSQQDRRQPDDQDYGKQPHDPAVERTGCAHESDAYATTQEDRGDGAPDGRGLDY